MRLGFVLAIPIALAGAPAFLAGQQTDFAPGLPRPGATLTFSNELIDAWDVRWIVGSPTPMHRHTKDYFGIELTQSRTVLTSPDGSERTVSLEPGRVWFRRAGVTHAETALTPRRAIIVELKAFPDRAAPADDRPPGPVDEAADPTIDADRVSIWDVTLRPDAPSSPRPLDWPVVLLFMEDTELVWTDAAGGDGRRSFEAGQVLYVPEGSTRAFGTESRPARVMIAELRSQAPGAGS